MATQSELAQKIESYERSPDPFVITALHNTAAAMVEQAAKVQPGQRVLLWFDGPGMPLVQQINLRCMALGAEVSYFMRDYDHDARILPTMTPDGIRHHFDEEEALMDAADVVIIVRGPEHPEAMKDVPKDLMAIYNQRYGEVHKRRNDGTVDWTLFLWPTAYEAAKEGLTPEEYFRVTIEACNQPWETIKKTQAKLKEKLDKGKLLELFANENDPDPKRRTHVSMSIKDMTFCNSTIDKNYPGSEVFSAPVMDSVNGQMFARGEYLYDGHLMRDIFLRIENGKIVEAYAGEGNEGLQAILSQGEGARYFGEVALGTNPGLTRRFFNPLLNEKVCGSFHMAIGHCYKLEVYDGEPVHVNNGNTEDRTPVHWDLTILMHRNADGSGGGRVVVDGETIQIDGRFVDPELAALNPQI